MAFLDRVRDDFIDAIDPAYDEDLSGALPKRFRSLANPDDKRSVLAEMAPQARGAGALGFVNRAARGFVGDASELGDSLFGLGKLAYRGAAYTAGHPGEAAAAVGDAASGAIADPMGTARVAGGALAKPFVENYTPREGESVSEMLVRRLVDHPLTSLMDVSALVGVPSSVAANVLERSGASGLANVAKMGARAAAELDPISMAKRVGGGIGHTLAPGAMARMEANRIITDEAAAAATRADYAVSQFQQKLRGPGGVFEGLEDAEKTLFFPYVEGRLKALPQMAGGVAELTPEGAWQPRAIAPERLARLEDARLKYLPILDEFEALQGWAPEVRAQQAALAEHEKALREGMDPNSPEFAARIEDSHATAMEKATEAYDLRRTVSTRTALDAAKLKEWDAAQKAVDMENLANGAAKTALEYPPKAPPTTVQEALDVMGPQSGVYFPHSGEIFTRGQATVGKMLTKVVESKAWKHNDGALFRTGALDGMDPELALIRTYASLRHRKGWAEIADEVGAKLGEKLGPGHALGSDADFRAGTHQPLKPAIWHQERSIVDDAQDLFSKLSQSEEGGAVDFEDLVQRMSDSADRTYPLARGAATYKIPKEVADALADFKRSFEPPTNPVAQVLDATADPFNYITLNLRPTRIMNNVAGNSIFTTMQGLHPFSTTGLGALIDMSRAGLKRYLDIGGEEAGKLAKVFDLPGVRTGGFTGSPQTTSKFGETLARAGGVAREKLGVGARKWMPLGERMKAVNEEVENFFRGASAMFELKNQRAVASMAAHGQHVASVGDDIAGLAAKGEAAFDDPRWKEALGSVNKFLNDYNRVTPFERKYVRRAFPYFKFYKHAVGLALHAPFDAPARTTMLRAIGGAARNDFREQLDGWGFPWKDVPSWLQTAVPVDTIDTPDARGEMTKSVRFINMQGPNPFSLMAVTDPGAEGLAALHPLIKVALEGATGINFFTGEKFNGPLSTYGGKEVGEDGVIRDSVDRPGPISNAARQLFPVQILRDIVAHGRQPLDTASLAEMLEASLADRPGLAFKIDDRGNAIRRPTPGYPLSTLLRLAVPSPGAPLQSPTKSQSRARDASISEEYNDLARRFPELRTQMSEKLASAKRERLARKRGGLAPKRQPHRRD